MRDLQAELKSLGLPGVQTNNKTMNGVDTTREEMLRLVAELERRVIDLESSAHATRELTARLRAILGGAAVDERNATATPASVPEPVVSSAVPQRPPMSAATPLHLLPTPQLSPGLPLTPPAAQNDPMSSVPEMHVVKASDLPVPRVQPVQQFGPASPAAAAAAAHRAMSIAGSGVPIQTMPHPASGGPAAPIGPGAPGYHPGGFRSKAELIRPPTTGLSPESVGMLNGIVMPDFKK